ncbi:ABC transporter ATP-binding protein [Deltaproteobacteria bacterium TL4]
MSAILLNQVSKWYRDHQFRRIYLIDALSLEVQSGEVFGFLGANGAGKTTTLKMIVGLSLPSSGSIQLFGKASSDPEARRTISFLPEQPQFPRNLKPHDFLNFSARLSKIPVTRSKIDQLLEQLGLSDAKNKAIHTFSKGMQQRLGIAQALLPDPQLLILDEPMSGLDPIGRQEVANLLLELKHQGKTIFFSTHILNDAQLLCDRISFLKKGKLLRIYDKHSFETEKSARMIQVSGLPEELLREMRQLYQIEYRGDRSGTWHIISPTKEAMWKILERIQAAQGHLLSVSMDPNTLKQYWT